MEHNRRFVLQRVLSIGLIVLFLLLPYSLSGAEPSATTVLVTAEGLADPEADTFKRDKMLLYDALLDDARSQAIEKVVGIYVDNRSLEANYMLIQDKVLTQSQGLIKSVLSKSEPWLGEDGFMHILIKAEVYTGKVENNLREMSQAQRVNLIKEFGNPRISVAIHISDADRSTDVKAQRSAVAENILKEHVSGFGYRVWSEPTENPTGNAFSTSPSVAGSKNADFTIRGEAKFRKVSVTMRASGITLHKHALTSWTVKCINNHTGEEIYFNNTIPKRRSWISEDSALEDVGRMIGKEFSRKFFEEQLMGKTKMYQVEVMGLPSYETAVLLKKELIGLRPVLNVDFRTFDLGTGALYEVEFSGSNLNFAQLVNSVMVQALNAKFDRKAFALTGVHDLVVKIAYNPGSTGEDLSEKFSSTPPSSLATATPGRLKSIVQSESARERVRAINPDAIAALSGETKQKSNAPLDTIMNF